MADPINSGAAPLSSLLEMWTEGNVEGGTKMPRNKKRKKDIIECRQGKYAFYSLLNIFIL